MEYGLVSQYNSLFLVRNGNGQVVTWQLTSSTSLDQVQSVIRCVSERSKNQQQPIECIYVDDCCKVRKNYKQYLVTRLRSNLIFFMQFNELLEHPQRVTHFIFNALVNCVICSVNLDIYMKKGRLVLHHLK